MEEDDSARMLAEQPQAIHSQQAATSQEGSTHSSSSQRTPNINLALDAALLPQVPTGENPIGERARWSARGEPAIHLSQSTQDSTHATCQYIVGLLGQITEHQDGILRELRAMRREMRLMQGEQRRTSARVVSLAHNMKAVKEQRQ